MKSLIICRSEQAKEAYHYAQNIGVKYRHEATQQHRSVNMSIKITMTS